MSPLQGTTALILAGGLGTRLREAVADRPKVLAEVNGRPFLATLLDRLANSGIRRSVLCTGYMAEQVRSCFGSRYNDMNLLYSEEGTPLGTGGALRLALPLIDSDPVLVMNGDSFCDANLGIFFNRHAALSATASLILARVADVGRYGAVETDCREAVVSFIEKGLKEGEGLINAGIYLLARSVIAAIPADKPVSLEREVFPTLIGHGLYGFYQHSRFIDIGIPSDYHAAATVICDSQRLWKIGDKP